MRARNVSRYFSLSHNIGVYLTRSYVLERDATFKNYIVKIYRNATIMLGFFVYIVSEKDLTSDTYETSVLAFFVAQYYCFSKTQR